VTEARPTIAARCEELGRDPATLRISVNINRAVIGRPGAERIDLLGAYAEAGVDRVMGLLLESVDGDEALESVVADARAASVRLTTG
jgi:hypothetical protein